MKRAPRRSKRGAATICYTIPGSESTKKTRAWEAYPFNLGARTASPQLRKAKITGVLSLVVTTTQEILLLLFSLGIVFHVVYDGSYRRVDDSCVPSIGPTLARSSRTSRSSARAGRRGRTASTLQRRQLPSSSSDPVCWQPYRIHDAFLCACVRFDRTKINQRIIFALHLLEQMFFVCACIRLDRPMTLDLFVRVFDQIALRLQISFCMLFIVFHLQVGLMNKQQFFISVSYSNALRHA